MTPAPTASLLALHDRGRLSRGHVERLAAALGDGERLGRIPSPTLANVFLHEGRLCFGAPDGDGDRLDAIARIVAELAILGQQELGNWFLAAWLEASGEFGALPALRRRIAEQASSSPEAWPERDSAHAGADPNAASRLAARFRAGRRGEFLAITHGLSAAGKTTIATALVGVTGAVAVRNDAEVGRRWRDRGCGFAPGQLAERLETLAATALAAGWPVIVESCFLERESRQRFRALAADLGAAFIVLDCQAPLATIRERLHKRCAFGSLLGSGDLDEDSVAAKLDAQLARREPLDATERALAVTIDTAKPVDHGGVAERVLGLQREVASRSPQR